MFVHAEHWTCVCDARAMRLEMGCIEDFSRRKKRARLDASMFVLTMRVVCVPVAIRAT